MSCCPGKMPRFMGAQVSSFGYEQLPGKDVEIHGCTGKQLFHAGCFRSMTLFMLWKTVPQVPSLVPRCHSKLEGKDVFVLDAKSTETLTNRRGVCKLSITNGHVPEHASSSTT
jgi:hypothetical protein